MPIFRNPALDPNDPNDPNQPQPAVDTTVTGSTSRAPAVATTPRAAVRAGQPSQPRGGLLSLIGLGGDQGGQSSSLADRLGFGGGYDDDFRSRLNKLGSIMMMMDPMGRDAGVALLGMEQNRAAQRQTLAQANQTVQWLINTQHMDPQEAMMLARDPAALREWYKTMQTSKLPKWEVHEMYNAKGQKTQVRVDVNSGKYQVMGGAEAPTLTYGTAYDDQGREIHVLINPHDAGAPPIQIGGPKTDVLTPEAEAQKIRIEQAAKPSIVMQGEGEYAKTTQGEKGFGGYFNTLQDNGRKANSMLDKLNVMSHIVEQPDFESGGFTPLKQQLLRIGQSLGIQVDDKQLANADLLNTMSKQLVRESFSTLGSGVSEGDRRLVEQTVANLEATRGGNRAIIALQRMIQQRAKDLAAFARQYNGGRIDAGFDDAANKALGPMITDEQAAEITKIGESDRTPIGGTDTGGDTGGGRPHIGGGRGAGKGGGGGKPGYREVPGHPGVLEKIPAGEEGAL